MKRNFLFGILFCISFKLLSQKGQFKELPLPLNTDTCFNISFNSLYLNESVSSGTFCRIGLKTYKKSLWLQYFTTNSNIELEFNLPPKDSSKYFIRVYTQDINGFNMLSCNEFSAKNNQLHTALTALKINKTILIELLTNEDVDQNLNICVKNIELENSSCDNAIKICSKLPFKYKLKKINRNNQISNTCLEEPGTSVWFKWKIKKEGSLKFTINYNVKTVNDLDFVLFKSEISKDDCSKLSLVRCSNAFSKSTGLNDSSKDESESGPFADGFVKSVSVNAEEIYYLVVRNFYSDLIEFDLNFSGDATLYGDKPTFDSDLKDKMIFCKSTNLFFLKEPSTTKNFKEVVWQINNGNKFINFYNVDTISHTFTNFGLQNISLLTVDSFSCFHNETKDYFVNPCCEDNNVHIQKIESKENVCFGEKKASLSIFPNVANENYLTKIIDVDAIPIKSLNRKGFGEGEYKVILFDSLGCSDTAYVQIQDPDRFKIKFKDQNIIKEMGDEHNISIYGNYPISNISYTQKSDACPYSLLDDRLDQTIIIKAAGTIYAMATSEDGCSALDTLSIQVYQRPSIICANIMSKNIINQEVLKCYLKNEIVESIDFSIYDRYGNLMFNLKNLSSAEEIKWDGRFRDTYCQPGIFTWKSTIRYIDCTVENSYGSVLIL